MNDKTVIIESFLMENPERVCVYEFSEETGQILIDLEVCSKDEALSKYRVVGELNDGNILLYNSEFIEEEPDLYDEVFEEVDDE